MWICPYCGSDDVYAAINKGSIKKMVCKRCRMPFEVEETQGSDTAIDTKKASYEQTKELRKNQRNTVLKCILDNPDICRREIGEMTGIEKSSVCGRVGELKESNQVYLSGTKYYKTLPVDTLRAI